ncbi:hypothetical protein FACS1894142_2180 [Spirochaetia bacterium]|nr:hypothetical protein FACS1894142_2180 [Spirochaetia bacterium]
MNARPIIAKTILRPAVLFFVSLLASCLLAGCDDFFNKPIEPFIQDQTAEVRFLDITVNDASVGLTVGLTGVQSDGLILIPPADTAIGLNFEYTGAYALVFSARMVKNDEEPVDVPVTETGPNQITIAITAAAPEDRFKLTLQISTANRWRSFDDFEFPIIYCREVGSVTPVSAKEITAFRVEDTVTNIWYAGVVSEAASPKTVTINVPYGTNLTGMDTLITHTGASVSPASGAAQDFTNTVSYTVTAVDGSQAVYTVTVNVGTLTSKAITAFSVSDGTNTWPVTATPSAHGSISGTAIIINASAGTAKNSMTVSVTHTGASITDGTTEQSGPTITFNSVNFSSPVTFTVKAADTTTQAYTVIVNAEPALIYGFSKGTVTGGDLTFVNNTHPSFLTYAQAGDSITVTFTPNLGYAVTGGTYSYTPAGGSFVSITPTLNAGVWTYTITMPTANITVDAAFAASSKAIVSFSVKELGTTMWYAGVVDNTVSPKTVTIDVPYGTNLTNMDTAITHTGASVSSPSGAAQQTFVSGTPVTYTVTPVSGSTETYQVTVNEALASNKMITSFTLAGKVGTIINTGDTTGTITVTVPYGTNLASIAPLFSIAGNSVSPLSGVAQDFSTGSVSYTVTAADGSPRTYTVTATAAVLSSVTITGYKSTYNLNESFDTATGTVTGIDNAGNAVSIPLSDCTFSGFDNTTAGTQTITLTVSGVSTPFTVTVLSGDKAITSFTLAGKAGTITDTSDTTGIISVTVPYNTNRTSMSGSVTHTGASITHPGGTTTTFTGVNFNSSQNFIVTAADNSQRTYGVTATAAALSSVTITGYKSTYNLMNPSITLRVRLR